MSVNEWIWRAGWRIGSDFDRFIFEPLNFNIDYVVNSNNLLAGASDLDNRAPVLSTIIIINLAKSFTTDGKYSTSSDGLCQAALG